VTSLAREDVRYPVDQRIHHRFSPVQSPPPALFWANEPEVRGETGPWSG